MTIFRSKDPCAPFRPALADWVEHRISGPATPSAFDHLAQCRRCEDELTQVAQTVIRLRRLADHISDVEPPTDGWPVLRARLQTSRRGPRLVARTRWSMIGSMLGPAVIAALAFPIATATPIGAGWVDDGTSVGGHSISAPRPMYDSGTRRLTEEIVLVLAGRAPAGPGGSSTLSATPSSTDRRDDPRVAHRAPVRSESNLPRSATRS